ncbi:uncharacterized protein PGTG_10393 [Puccinia graminis f. sp. tritici CRL 75-36-700-3]|uniref:Protein HIR n=1 Tax=Puccinia graminis f. sp. tritici (strain CRL 75-36-700-3 / race SCCL) TaxID=418459 RepID=E3KKU7_PUCGT|nr:uncharacterized protein PGTG_10393 [Puccinia graminis f. sp. tritici CRL 75-36-700-3]EFP84922.2 hypothetical protein PGTG_10393 [Puccinia graminis f. sp. tritici CRL 75-36-700-3]
MRIIKPNWVIHPDDKGNPQTIYSAHVHPDGTRLATGSIQNVVKIWSTAPILDPAVEETGEEKAPRLLCAMEGHDGAVLCVRWAFSGAFLATGSDDSIIMVWLRCPGQSKSFGSKTANIEDWKCFKRLAGHTSDVQGLAWSEDDQYLASVGLDSLVLIWDCLDSAFVLLKRLDLHQGHVNGVVWDPVGQYLATQSDDRTVKIWRTTDWKLEADIEEPFVNSPHSFFRRLSWSPDGTHIVTPNAMNGPVFVSAVIDRCKWTSNISLVGHENVVEVAAYNPLLFLRDRSKPIEGPNLSTVFALGARNSVSIWHNCSSCPIVVLHDVFDRDILDLSWAADGITLYACSSEGRVAAFVINELTTLAAVAPPGAKAKYLETYEFTKPDRRSQKSRSSSTPFAPRYASPMPPIGPYRPGRSSPPPSALVPNSMPSNTLITQQEMTIMPNGKRRIKPAFLGTNESAIFLSAMPNGHASTPVQQPNSSQNSHTLFPQSNRFPQATPSTSTLLPTRHAVPTYLSDDLISSNSVSRELAEIMHWNDFGKWGEPIAMPTRILKRVHCNQTEFQVNCENTQGDMDAECSEVVLSSNKTDKKEELWKERFSDKSITAASLSTSHVAIGLSDKSLSVYSYAGRRVMPVIVLDCPCFKIQFRGNLLMSISLKGTVMVWDLTNFKAISGPSKLKHLCDSRALISFTALTHQGAPIVKVRKESLFVFDEDLKSWTVLSGHTMDEMKDKDRLDHRQLKFPSGSPFLVDSALVLAANKPDLLGCIVDHVRFLRDHNRFQVVDELCHELWTGSGWISNRNSKYLSATPTFKLSRMERIKLLYQVIEVLDENPEFRPICQEYSLLLKHNDT